MYGYTWSPFNSNDIFEWLSVLTFADNRAVCSNPILFIVLGEA